MKTERSIIEVKGLSVSCLFAGEHGSLVVLLHGGGTDSVSLSWGKTIGPLSCEHRLFAPDLPGYGQSDKPYLPYTTDYYVNFLGELLDALGSAGFFSFQVPFDVFSADRNPHDAVREYIVGPIKEYLKDRTTEVQEGPDEPLPK